MPEASHEYDDENDEYNEYDETGSSDILTKNYGIFRECLAEIVVRRLSSEDGNEEGVSRRKGRERRTERRKAKRKKHEGKKAKSKNDDGRAERRVHSSDGDEERQQEQDITPEEASDTTTTTTTTPPPSSDPPPDQPQPTTDLTDLSDFIDYLSTDLFASLPLPLRTLSYSTTKNDPDLAASYTPPLPASTLAAITSLIPASTLDSLLAYDVLPHSSSSFTDTDTHTHTNTHTNTHTHTDAIDTHTILKTLTTPLITSYTTATTTPPPSLLHLANPTHHHAGSKASACEICDRDWIPLTYHHLIPRAVHDKAVKRGWCQAWEVSAVAWLCRACHSMVHRVAGNEELARRYASVEKLMGRGDVRAFAGWVGGVRWKAR